MGEFRVSFWTKVVYIGCWIGELGLYVLAGQAIS